MVVTRAEINFVQGYLEALDCRNTHTRTVLRAQICHPLPLGQDDASQFDSVLHRLGAKVLPMSEMDTGEAPKLDRRLLEAPTLYVTTDAGHDPPVTLLGAERGGLGIVIASSEFMQIISFGMSLTAGSSSPLEWLAKLMGMLLLEQYTGYGVLLCDNASVHIGGHYAIIQTHSSIDRLARFVLQLDVWNQAHEMWLPAQHDSGHTSRAAMWQKEADAAATRGKDHRERYPMPWKWLALLWVDVPYVPLYGCSVVINRKRFCSDLYVHAAVALSPLARDVSRRGLDGTVWTSVCESNIVTPAQHKFIAYVRVLPYIPRFQFEVPDCRYCDMVHANQWSHVSVCLQLYIRACRAFVDVCNVLRKDLGLVIVSHWDQVTCLKKHERTYWCALCPDTELLHLQKLLARMGADQTVIYTWTAMVHVHDKDKKSHVYIPRSTLVTSTVAVAQTMSHPVPNHPVHLPAIAPGDEDVYDTGPSGSTTPDLGAQQVASWLLRWDPRLRLHLKTGYKVSLGACTMSIGEYAYALMVCTQGHCYAKSIAPHVRQVILCSCTTRLPQHWNMVVSGPGWLLVGDDQYALAPLALL